jgi:YD repeat-containing protein
MTYVWDNYGIDALNDGVSTDGLYENYTLDDAGNVTAITERTGVSDPSLIRTYNYDGQDRLATNARSTYTPETFAYDATGDRATTVSGTFVEAG